MHSCHRHLRYRHRPAGRRGGGNMKPINPHVLTPTMVRIKEAADMTGHERFFRLRLPRPLGHRPGQFVMVSVPGIGEAPISICCGPGDHDRLELLVRSAGSLTMVLQRLETGDQMGIRGPFGTGFDLADFEGRDVLFVAGGLGLAPLRSLIEPLILDRQRFGRITIISGCRTPAEELFGREMRTWARAPGIRVIRLVNDTAHLPWDGEVGLVTAPIAGLDMDPAATLAVLCGPPVMYKFVIMELAARGLAHDRIFIDLERRMRCGIGKCGHCQINHLTCCQDGPVFRLSSVESLPEALA
ncbi:MAG TPA: oxidoreductase [Desulfobacteraceae bacterium]|nr:oxidoreductase [Desulfobacteraceae bacterium]